MAIKIVNEVMEVNTAIADAIYARRCDEHAFVKKDCPLVLSQAPVRRPIAPYCGKWCVMLDEPTAFIDNNSDIES